MIETLARTGLTGAFLLNNVSLELEISKSVKSRTVPIAGQQQKDVKFCEMRTGIVVVLQRLSRAPETSGDRGGIY